ncbi:MAG: hypothetical protein C0613_07745 [Desulfobulbaceae bacterium]|nr:MAG: hypothetical protein C0613_07745 [Desulfobulbaceae bacterium]
MNRSENPATDEQQDDAWARLFDLAATLYLHEPGEAQLKRCRIMGMALTDLLPDETFPQLFQAAANEEVVTLQQEFFDHLFVPVSTHYCPPYAAMQGKDIPAPPLLDIRPLFQETGFDPAHLKGLPAYLRGLGRVDYIGFELAFMAILLQNALLEKEAENREALLQTADLFHEKHLRHWAADFSSRLDEKARSSYFKGCAQLTGYLATTFACATDF